MEWRGKGRPTLARRLELRASPRGASSRRSCSASRSATCWRDCRSTGRRLHRPGVEHVHGVRRLDRTHARALCLLHGATFLAIRTTDDSGSGHAMAADAGRRRTRDGRWCSRSGPRHGAAGMAGLSAARGRRWSAIVGAFLATRRGRRRLAFIATAIAIAATVGSLFASLFPKWSSRAPRREYSLTIAGRRVRRLCAHGDDGSRRNLLPDRAAVPGLHVRRPSPTRRRRADTRGTD